MSERKRLPDRRRAETTILKHGKLNTEFALTVGYFDDGGVAEVFISGAKSGSEIDAITRDGAVLLSLAMQYGVPLETMRRALTREADGSPSTIVGKVVDLLVMEGER